VGVIGGVFTCAQYFVRVAIHAADVISGADTTPGIVAAEATGVKRKWAGGQFRVRSTAQIYPMLQTRPKPGRRGLLFAVCILREYARLRRIR
jgi:hypothetical protein